jgi:metal-dependent HD superfamily phosphatase/phosphodiesterase
MGYSYAYVDAATLNPVTVKQYNQHKQIHVFILLYFIFYFLMC